jgi:hypothetical protein
VRAIYRKHQLPAFSSRDARPFLRGLVKGLQCPQQTYIGQMARLQAGNTPIITYPSLKHQATAEGSQVNNLVPWDAQIGKEPKYGPTPCLVLTVGTSLSTKHVILVPLKSLVLREVSGMATDCFTMSMRGNCIALV